MNDNKINFVTRRTKAGTIVEIVCALIVLFIWIVTGVVAFHHKVNNVGELVGNAVFFTIIVAVLLFLTYKPKTVNLPEVPTERHYHLAVWCLRAIAMEIAVMFLFIQLQEIGWVAADIPEFIIGFVVLLTAAVFSVMMRRR